MRFLRTAPTRRILAVLIGAVLAGCACAAIAIAAVGQGPVPRREPLAKAIHQALKGKSVAGLSASITFTDNLVGASYLQESSDPLLTGAPGRLWIGDGRIRLELQSDNGDSQIVFDGGSFWMYDGAQNVVYRGKLSGSLGEAKRAGRARQDRIPTVAAITRDLKRLGMHLGISRATPTDVGGKAAYRVALSPKARGGLIGGLHLAWDAIHGIPLDLALYARGEASPVLELKAGAVSYGKVPSSVFDISPPSGAKVVHIDLSELAHGRSGHATKGAKVLRFGQGPGTVLVLEHRIARSARASSGASQSDSSSQGSGLTLPTVRIEGVTAQQLPTPIGTILMFERHGISYVVLGSVTAHRADAVARAAALGRAATATR